MKHAEKTLIIILLVSITTCIASNKPISKHINVPMTRPCGFVWKSEVPQDCPFKQSPLFDRIYFTGCHSDYKCGDRFYPSWANNGNLYSPWTDGSTDGVRCKSYRGKDAHTGHAVMIGDDPLSLTIKNTSPPKNGKEEFC